MNYITVDTRIIRCMIVLALIVFSGITQSCIVVPVPSPVQMYQVIPVEEEKPLVDKCNAPHGDSVAPEERSHGQAFNTPQYGCT